MLIIYLSFTKQIKLALAFTSICGLNDRTRSLFFNFSYQENMSDSQPLVIPASHFVNIGNQLDGVLVAGERPPVIIQLTSDFVASIIAGQTTLFSLVQTAEKPRGCITFDSNRMHFFSDDKYVEGLEVMHVKPFTQKFGSVDEIKAFHRDLFSKPFAFKTKLEARRKSDKFLEGNVTYVNRAEVIVTAFPQHPDVAAIVMAELTKAEESVSDDEKCSFEISFDRLLRRWFGDCLLQTTGKDWNSRGAVLGWKSSIITTNHSAPINFCGHIACRLFGILLCPIWCCACCWYTIYRSKTSKDQTIHFDFTSTASA